MKIKRSREFNLVIIALAIVSATPRPASAQLADFSSIAGDITTVSNILGNITNATSGGSSGGEFSINNMLGNLTQIGNVVGYDIPDLGNLTDLGGLGGGGGYAWDESIPGGAYGNGSGTYGSDGNIPGLGGGNGGLFGTGFSQQDLQKVTSVATTLKGLYGSITSGNVGGVLSGLKGLLGAFGVISPQAASSTTSGQGVPSTGGSTQHPDGSSTDASGNPTDPSAAIAQVKTVPAVKDAVSPSHAYFLGNVADSVYRDTIGNLAETVLGSVGRNVMASQAQESALSLSLSQKAQQGLYDQVQESVKAAQASVKGAAASTKASQDAQQAKDSQTVLKNISTQLALEAQQNAVASGQLSVLSTNTFELGTQLVALQAQGKLHHDQLRTLQILSAAQADAQIQISNLASRHLQYDQEKDDQAVIGGAQAAANVYVPGYATGN